MTVSWLKRAAPRPATETADLRDMVSIMLTEIERGGDERARRYGAAKARLTLPRRGRVSPQTRPARRCRRKWSG